MFTTGKYVYHWYICLPLIHMVTTGTYVCHWDMFTSGTYGYHWYMWLPLVHMVTTGTYGSHCAFKNCVCFKFTVFFNQICSHWMSCKMLEMMRRYEMSKKAVLLIGTFLAAKLTVVGIRAERWVMSRRWGLISSGGGNLITKGKGKVHPCTGTEALYRPYGP